MMNVEKQSYANAMNTFGLLGNSNHRSAAQKADQPFVNKSPAQNAQIAAIQAPAVNEARIRSQADSFGHPARPAAAVAALATGIVAHQRATSSNSLGL